MQNFWTLAARSLGAVLCATPVGCEQPLSTRQLSAAERVQAPQTQERLERVFDAPGFSLRLTLAALPNLTYHLDCLSATVFCSSGSFRSLWRDLGLTAEDEAVLSRWKSLRTRFSGTVIADPQLAAAPLLLSGAWIDLAERQRIAARRAETLDDFEATLALLTDEECARELRAIASRFEARFQQYWLSKGRAAGAAYFADLAQLLGDPFLVTTVARVAAFDGLPVDGNTKRTYRLQVLVQPQTGHKGLRAYQMESDFEVESPEQGKAVDVIDVIAHELCHALLRQMPAEAKHALTDAFLQSDDPYSLVDYGLFDEALATSVGNGLVWRHFHPHEDFEQHRSRDFHSLYKPAATLAVALLPGLEALLATDATAASPAFVRTLGEAARASYRAHGPTPIDYLHSHVLVSTPALESAANKVRDAAFAGFPYLREFKQLDAEAIYFLQKHPQLNAAVYLPSTAPLPELLRSLGMETKRSSELQALLARDRGLVYTMRLTAKTYLFLFVASDEASALELADAFIALREMHDGTLIELAR